MNGTIHEATSERPLRTGSHTGIAIDINAKMLVMMPSPGSCVIDYAKLELLATRKESANATSRTLITVGVIDGGRNGPVCGPETAA